MCSSLEYPDGGAAIWESRRAKRAGEKNGTRKSEPARKALNFKFSAFVHKTDKTYRWEFGHTTPQRPPDGYNRFFLGSPLRCCNLTACFHFLYNQASSAILYHYLHQNVPLCIPQGPSQGLIVDKPRCLLECPSVYHRLFPIVRCRRSPRVHSIDRLQLGELRQSTPI